MTEIQPYADAIYAIRNKSEKSVNLSHLPRSIQIQTHMFSNTKTPVPRFILDNKVIPRNNSILVGYNCLQCGVQNEITLNLYLRKVSKGVRCCNACKNLDPVKRSNHSTWMSGEKIPCTEVKWMDKPLRLRLEESTQAFADEDTEFQTSYFLNHMTVDEFNRVREKIKSVGQGKITDLSGWTYFPYYRIWNHTRYTPMLVRDNQIEKPAYVKWTCDVCDQEFVNRDLEIQKNRVRILCVDCGFCNRTFKVRSMKTPWGKIRYQSVQERRWIDWCIEHAIHVTNGPRIVYSFAGTQHKYSVDFSLPELNTLIEIKDNHVWHKRQLESGKWAKKEEAAQQWCADHGMTYGIVFPKTLSKWKEDLLVRYSLTLQETVRSKDKEPCDNIGGNL